MLVYMKKDIMKNEKMTAMLFNKWSVFSYKSRQKCRNPRPTKISDLSNKGRWKYSDPSVT